MPKTFPFPFLAFILIATRVYAQNVVCDPLCHEGTTTTTPSTTAGGGTTAQGAPLRRRVPRESGKPRVPAPASEPSGKPAEAALVHGSRPVDGGQGMLGRMAASAPGR